MSVFLPTGQINEAMVRFYNKMGDEKTNSIVLLPKYYVTEYDEPAPICAYYIVAIFNKTVVAVPVAAIFAIGKGKGGFKLVREPESIEKFKQLVDSYHAKGIWYSTP